MSQGTRLWHLTRLDDGPDCDEAEAFVVCTDTEADARLLCLTARGDEGDIWELPDRVKCTFIGWAAPGVERGIIQRAFRPG